MSRVFGSTFLVALLVGAIWAQTPDPQQPPPATTAPASQQPSGATSQPVPQAKKPNRMKEHFRSWCMNFVAPVCWSFGKPQTSQDTAQQQAQEPPQREKLPPPNDAPPRAPKSNSEESSSSDTKIDLSPPADDSKHPGANASDDVSEFHVYDPHKADKDIEVGDFYFKRKNYQAAVNRYRSALNWKPNDAIATFRLAQSLERTGQLEDARKNYEGYLKILPNGPNSPEAKSALQRLMLESQSRSDTPEKRR